ncbi:unnamed protein product [Gadus morhua 'NCC']
MSECVCVCLCDRDNETENECKNVVRGRGGGGERERDRERERVRERERERERERSGSIFSLVSECEPLRGVRVMSLHRLTREPSKSTLLSRPGCGPSTCRHAV